MSTFMSRASLRVAGVARGLSLKYCTCADAPLLPPALAPDTDIPGRVSLMSPTAVAAGSLLLGAPFPFAWPFAVWAGAAAVASPSTS